MLANLSQSHISAIENGGDFYFTEIIKIADIFKIQYFELLPVQALNETNNNNNIYEHSIQTYNNGSINISVPENKFKEFLKGLFAKNRDS